MFNAVAELAPDQREGVLRRLCAGQPELEAEVRSLLIAHEGVPAFMATATGAAAPPPPQLDTPILPGYRLIGRLGAGGMGEVYSATRAVAGTEQPVAIKLVRHGRLRPDVLARFERERRILAGLDHPGICRLLDAGVTEDGRPYLVMPIIEGAESVRVYCDRRRLSVDARVALFVQVCRAVQHAHQRLVVHADLKPQNLLVTAAGVPMVLDFGIARLLRPEPEPAEATRLAGDEPRPMTPAYASPEQLRGQAPDTASDVFSLGLVLYELLSGQAAFDLPAQASTERRLTRIGQGAPNASTRCADLARVLGQRPSRLRTELRGDLDNILDKALQVEPDGRYGSAAALADDLDRWRQRLPVQAHAPGAWYQMRKFASRHRVGVSVAAAGLVALVTFAVVVSGLAVQIARQAQQLRVERDRAETVVSFMSELFNATNPMATQGGAPTAEAMLERGLRLVDDLGQEEQRATLTVIGGAYAGLGQFESARQVLDRALALPPPPTASLAQASLVREHAALEYRLDHLQIADAAAGEALALARQVLDDDDPRLAPFMNTLGITAMDLERSAEAETLLTRAVALRREAGVANEEVADALRALADLLHTQKRYDEAAQRYEESIATYTRATGPDGPMIAIVLNNYAAMRRRQDRIEDALAGYERARQIAEKGFGENHPFLGVANNNIGRMYLRLERPDEALVAYRRGIAINRAALPPQHPTLARSLGGWAEAQIRLGHADRARPALREAIDIFEQSGRGDTQEARDYRDLLDAAVTGAEAG